MLSMLVSVYNGPLLSRIRSCWGVKFAHIAMWTRELLICVLRQRTGFELVSYLNAKQRALYTLDVNRPPRAFHVSKRYRMRQTARGI